MSSKGSSKLIDVIVLNWNGKKDTLECLRSLDGVATTHRTTVVDNGSTDDSVFAIRQTYPQVRIIETGKNLGYAEGNNVGIGAALEDSAENILVLNNDTFVSPGMLEGFLKSDCPLQGGRALLWDDTSKLDHLGGNWNPKEHRFDPIGFHEPEMNWSKPISLDYVCGVSLFAHRVVWERVGLFDARYFLLWEEADWCARARKLGYQPTSCPDATLLHRGSASFVGGSPHTFYYWTRNRLLWMESHCSREEQNAILKTTQQDFRKARKRYVMNSIQSFFKKATPQKRRQNRIYRAELSGIRDYHCKRFGQGPAWLTS